MSAAESKDGNPARYLATPPTLTDGQASALMVDANGYLMTTAVFSAGDIQIGAVEIKNATDDTRATVTARGLQVESSGAIASGAADSGNPVKVGGVYNSTLPTLTNAQRGDLQVGTRGSLHVEAWSTDASNPITAIASNADGQTVGSNGTRYEVMSRHTAFNGTTFDRFRNNNEATILSSAVRAVTTNGTDQTNYNGRGVMLLLSVTVEAAAETLSLKIQAKDSISSGYADYIDFGVLYNAGTAAPGVFAAVVYPGLIAADLISGAIGKSAPLPRIWRPVITHSASGNWTYSLSSESIL